MASAVEAVNAIGTSVFSVVSGFISVNFVVGDAVVRSASFLAGLVASAFVSIARGVEVGLEDLLVFLRECCEIVIDAVEFAFAVIDNAVAAVVGGVMAVKCAVVGIANAVYGAASTSASAVASAGTALGSLVTMVGASLLLLVQLVPMTAYLAFEACHRSAAAVIGHSLDAARSVVEAFRNAPGEMFVGLLVGSVILYSSAKVASRVVRAHHITPSLALSTAFHVLAFVYLNFVRGVIVTLGALLHVVMVMLSHAHVPRFHHAGDSDAEDEADAEGLVGPVDDSDNEDRAREEQKRRNYDLLLRRRNTRKKRKDADDVEDLLFEQVTKHIIYLCVLVTVVLLTAPYVPFRWSAIARTSCA